jgi:hypothetical protein
MRTAEESRSCKLNVGGAFPWRATECLPSFGVDYYGNFSLRAETGKWHVGAIEKSALVPYRRTQSVDNSGRARYRG